MSSLDNLPIYVGVLTVLWIYLPGFLINTFAMLWGKWLPKTGYTMPIDGGRVAWDGNRLFGDEKTWNGLIGGSLTSGLLCYLQVIISSESSNVFINPIQGWESSLLGSTNEFTVAFCIGTFLGFTALLGDMTGSFFKRRKGLKREGDTSSKTHYWTLYHLQCSPLLLVTSVWVPSSIPVILQSSQSLYC